ncbi:dihydropteroate synthase [Luteolibacter flavescens]|uniref:Dihydropteroate synthase n=1 Tax=Luteolibacter flavescens TaxID=1859460 RepID=A0ABT3FRC7_9BACT|nr:dihydropteroate synthase [Luteolibacter flavescens]MCW1885754.1 dihydropteroate synthase [Luteolibacter flavescens]
MWWKTARTRLDLGQRGMIMGILNTTPDSFSDGGSHAGVEAAVAHARQMIADGAAIIDIGGESTRPGAGEVAVAEEIARTAPVIAALRAEWAGAISIDTMKASVAAAALEAGADIVNDVSGLTADPDMERVCVESGCGVAVMHMQGDPRTMQVAPDYEDVVAEVRRFFEERLLSLVAAGIDAEAICFDPGIGFGKTVEHNLALLRALANLNVGGRPLLLGVSRKSFIGRVLGSTDLADRSWPTVAITAWAREAGAMIHRVHEVRPNTQALRMTEAILQGGNSAFSG